MFGLNMKFGPIFFPSPFDVMVCKEKSKRVLQRFSVLENLTEKMKYWRPVNERHDRVLSHTPPSPLCVFCLNELLVSPRVPFIWVTHWMYKISGMWAKCRISLLKLCICVQVFFFHVQISCLDFLSLTVMCSCHWTVTYHCLDKCFN